VWASVLQYNTFAMDRHIVQALIEAWNPEAKAFMIGYREVPFSYFDIALLTGLPATGRLVVFERGEETGEVEQLLMATMEDCLEREWQQRQTVHMDVRICRNYVSVMIDLCPEHNTVESPPMFGKLYPLLVLSGLLFLHSAGGLV